MQKTSKGKTGPHFSLNGTPSMPATPRQKNALKNFGVMNEEIKKCPKLRMV
jgi:hypothetical protein